MPSTGAPSQIVVNQKPNARKNLPVSAPKQSTTHQSHATSELQSTTTMRSEMVTGTYFHKTSIRLLTLLLFFSQTIIQHLYHYDL